MLTRGFENTPLVVIGKLVDKFWIVAQCKGILLNGNIIFRGSVFVAGEKTEKLVNIFENILGKIINIPVNNTVRNSFQQFEISKAALPALRRKQMPRP